MSEIQQNCEGNVVPIKRVDVPVEGTRVSKGLSTHQESTWLRTTNAIGWLC